MLNNLSKLISIVAILTFASIVFSSNKAEAATIPVAFGNDTVAVDSSCSLSEAIGNINDQAVTNADCAAGDGVDDTITLPSGTITLTADLPTITESIKIIGQGMANTTIDGDNGQYRSVTAVGPTKSITLADFRITGALRGGPLVTVATVNIQRLDIDGANALPDPALGGGTGSIGGIGLLGDASPSADYTVSDVYIHDFNNSASYGVFGFIITTAGGNTANVDIEKVTIARLHNTSSSIVNGFSLNIGGSFGPPSTGTMAAQIRNVTVDDLQSDNNNSIGFGALAFANGGEATINLDVQNITLTRIVGTENGIPSIGLYTGTSAIGAFDEASANINTQNVLIGGNTSDGLPSNCNTYDLNPLTGGVGISNPTINSLGHNLSDDNSCTSFTQEGDMQNVSNLTSTLGPLQNNGGITATRALLPGSPAIGAGAAVLGISTDQRGIPRPSTPDVGAYQTVLGDTTTTIGPASSGSVGVPNSGFAPETSSTSKATIVFIVLSSISLANILIKRLKNA